MHADPPAPPVHVPALLEEALAFLAPERGGVFVDCTVGLGGHAAALLERFPGATLVGIDRDPEALAAAGERLRPYGARVRLLAGNYADLDLLLDEIGVHRAAGLLADLGVSSLQLDSAARGFSFRRDGPLDMRMGPGGLTAGEILNRYPEAELERILREYGEERDARRIARAVVRAREQGALATTGELRALITHVKRRQGNERGGGREGRIDPSTRAFQALRIEVNQELAGLRRLMEQAVARLETGGRLVVISYHSLEDRIVKAALRDMALGEVDEISGRPR
ncbi:MAG TPA: 16S rRNA (cytosine(1402)-N(4))-methyltransferase RsmH, partial [Thermoanaerobaculia bacterium]|nr:16S rRNA (cytosine(1402)-N(4))-methyltransferase RsmH [Thermoanaerobaculia bacterium]